MNPSLYWNQSPQDAARALETNLEQGLSASEAKSRLEKYGPNQLIAQETISALQLFFSQFKDYIVWILAAAAAVSGFLGETVDSVVIMAIVILNAILGFYQEYRAEKAISALKKLSSSNAKVIREGKQTFVPSVDLVPGDLIELEAGDKIPADGRLIWVTANFKCEEASLTGESVPVLKDVKPLAKEVDLGDRINMVFMGTVAVSGRAKAVVAATGMQTELGRIAGMVDQIKAESTPLQKKLEQFGKWIVLVSFVMVGLVFLMGWLRGGEFLEVFMTSVSLAVAAIPEGLPAVVTITLALGVHRLVKRNALIRKLPSVETLGSANVICSDKTGTLTKNEMTVEKIYAGGKLFEVSGTGYKPDGKFLVNQKEIRPDEFPDLKEVLLNSVLCNGALLIEEGKHFKILGDPTEGALLTAAAKAGLLKETLEKEHPFVNEIPFDSERKKMTIIRKRNQEMAAFVKGAPDVLLSSCQMIFDQGQVRKLTEEDRKIILQTNEALTQETMRVLATAYRIIQPNEPIKAETIEQNLILSGLIAMIDPPREEVKKAVSACQSAGIKVVMITGDHKNTAVAIAKSLGFFAENSLALTGAELDQKSDTQLLQEVDRLSVYARVSPEHKLRIVRAWRQKGAVVAMTGDGVNDAPAVKEADIGVAMGMTGTDVTKEISDMVITDDNFASIVAAIEEGRGIYDNIKKFIHYLLSCNMGEILVIFLASVFGWPVPLLPVHILWVNLVTDGLPALALGVDPVDPKVMQEKPRPRIEPVIPKPQAWLILFQGSLIAGCSLSAYAYIYFAEGNLERARTFAFIMLSTCQLVHAINCRSQKDSIFSLGLFSNSKLVIAIALSLLIQAAVIYIPFLQRILKVQSLSILDWGWILLISFLPLGVMEIFKAFRRKVTRQPSH